MPRKSFSRSLNTKLHAEKQWDTYFIVTLMRDYLPVFRDVFPDHFHTREFLEGISRIVDVRNAISHHGKLTESDVVGVVYQMARVLELTKNTIAAASVNSRLDEISNILEKCRSHAVLQHPQTIQLKISAAAYNAQLLYLALNAFEAHLEAEVAPFKYEGGTIGVPNLPNLLPTPDPQIRMTLVYLFIFVYTAGSVSVGENSQLANARSRPMEEDARTAPRKMEEDAREAQRQPVHAGRQGKTLVLPQSFRWS